MLKVNIISNKYSKKDRYNIEGVIKHPFWKLEKKELKNNDYINENVFKNINNNLFLKENNLKQTKSGCNCKNDCVYKSIKNRFFGEKKCKVDPENCDGLKYNEC